MTTSLSYNYSITAADLVNISAQDIGILAAGETLSSDDQNVMLTRLNLLVKQWQGVADMAPGLKVWTRKRISIFFVSGQAQFTVSSSSSDRAGLNTVATVLTAGKLANATSLTVSSTTGMTAADQIGICTTAGPIGWTTISSVDSATGLTLPANTIGAASVNGVVYTYTTQANRFVQLENATVRDNSSVGQPIDIPITIYKDLQLYEDIPQKMALGDPTAVWIEQLRDSTTVFTNRSGPNTWKTLNLTVLYPAEDYDATTNDIAFPQEWFAALEWELALRCCPAFGRVWTQEMQANYDRAVPIARQLNPANTVMYFMPGLD